MPTFLISRLLAAEGIRHGFSTRQGGVSAGPFASLNVGGSVGDDPAAVAENLRRLAIAAGVPGFATVHQVHGDRLLEGGPALEACPQIASSEGRVGLRAHASREDGLASPVGLHGLEPVQVIPGQDLTPRAEADGVLSVPGGRAPAVKTADCVPVLLYHRPSGRVAAVHAGWRGTRLRIAAGAVRALGGGEGVVAAIGPCIRRCCYEVSPELAAEFVATFGADVVDGRRLDLVAANRHALREAGVGEMAIEVVGGCTSCDADRHFSHRRDGGRTGRHLSWICPPAEPEGQSQG